ncbi:MAG: phosphomethylpyrimidine kinase [Frankiales bacterium]|nr:phosphomethylpyrimidine kinase [Frankiales bacterium]
MNPPVALTIAGSDSGGGAGIQADLKTFAALGVFGTSAITAVTAQNTREVRTVHPLPVEVVLAQVGTVLDDLPVRAVKTGLLATQTIVVAVAELAAAGGLPNLVVDPVMVSSSGHRLLERAAEHAYVELLLPHARVVTPNLLEAQALLGRTIRTLADQHAAARALGELGPATVVLKGGHEVSDSGTAAVDVVWDGATTYQLESRRITTTNNHGTGCTLASAIAAGLARGLDTDAAIRAAKDYVTRAIAGSVGWQLGGGYGPLDHFGWTTA